MPYFLDEWDRAIMRRVDDPAQPNGFYVYAVATYHDDEQARLIVDALCSSIPRAQIEAMESEMRHLSEVIVSANTEAYKDTLNTVSDRLSALLHPELKGEDKP